MIERPHRYIEDFKKAGADLITFHLEAYDQSAEVLDCLKLIKSIGLKAGLSIKPATDPSTLRPYLALLDLVLVMSVEPGFGGQSFMPSSLDKVAYLKSAKVKENYNYLIEVDGGVNDQNAPLLKAKGAEVLVSGSYIMRGDIASNIEKLK